MGWGPGPAKGDQNFQNMPWLWHHLQKTPTENKIFFPMLTIRLAESVEGLNSSLALAAGNLWPKKGRPIAAVEGLKKLCSVIAYLVKAVKLLIVALHGISKTIMMNKRGYCLHNTYLLWGELVFDVNWSNNSIQLKLFVVVWILMWKYQFYGSVLNS